MEGQHSAIDMSKVAQRTERFVAAPPHLWSQVFDHVASVHRSPEHDDCSFEGHECCAGDLVAPELSQQFLLCRQIEVLVRDDGFL